MGERQGSERAAVNAPIQGTSADIIKRAMVRMPPALVAAGLDGTRMLLQVHDELVFEVPEADVDRASAVIRSVMASAAEPAGMGRASCRKRECRYGSITGVAGSLKKKKK